MNITPQYTVQPLATAFNPQTENLRRENAQREVISQPTAPHHAPAEKGVAKDHDKSRQMHQANEQLDFAELQKKAEQQAHTINEQSGEHQQHSDQQSSQNTANQDTAEQDEKSQNQATEAESQQAKQPSEQRNSQEYTEAELAQIEQLKSRDQEVRRHEAAHAAVGGSSTGAPSLEYQQGPDGKRYAVNGEVSVDLSPVAGDPQATIAKMQQVHAAALAPVNPSSQDKRVAAKAAQQIVEAQAELMAIKQQQSPTPTDVPVKEAFASQQQSDERSEQSLKQSLAASDDFDQMMEHTLASQEQASPYISADVKQRALRIASFYQTIQQAYEQAPNHQFQLTA